MVEIIRNTANVSIRIKEFFTKIVTNPDGSTGEEHWVSYYPATQANMTVIEAPVKRLLDLQEFDNPQDLVLDIAYQRKEAIEPAYEMWKQGREMPLEGTAISAWNELNATQVNVIRHAGIRTVEELADATDSLVMMIRLPNQRDLRTKAQRFIAAKETNMASAKVEHLITQNDTMQRQIQELMEQNRMLMQQAQQDREASMRERMMAAKGKQKGRKDVDEESHEEAAA